MSSVIDSRPDIMWLSPSWVQHDNEPALRIEPNGFLLNQAAQEWVKAQGDGLRYIVIGISREEPYLYLTRTNDANYDRRVLVDRGLIQHWGLSETLKEMGYTIGAQLKFSETEDPDVISAYITKRGA